MSSSKRVNKKEKKGEWEKKAQKSTTKSITNKHMKFQAFHIFKLEFVLWYGEATFFDIMKMSLHSVYLI